MLLFLIFSILKIIHVVELFEKIKSITKLDEVLKETQVLFRALMIIAVLLRRKNDYLLFDERLRRKKTGRIEFVKKKNKIFNENFTGDVHNSNEEKRKRENKIYEIIDKIITTVV